MLTLDLTNAPRWHDLAPGVRVQLRPLTTALMVATRSDPAVDTVPDDGSDEERAVAFAKSETQYGNLKAFYEEQYSDAFCSSMTEEKLARRKEALTAFVIEIYKKKHGEEPTKAQIAGLMAKERVCHNGYIIQADVSPNSYWHYIAIYLLLIGIVMWNLRALVKWSRTVMPR